MSKIAVFVVDNVEEIECLSVVDFCRRAGISVTTFSLTGSRVITGAHKIRFECDALFGKFRKEDYSAIVLPGGGGYVQLEAHAEAMAAVRSYYEKGKLVAAICASPGILARLGILNGRKATVYPGMTVDNAGVNWTGARLETDGNVITGNGPAAGAIFALEIIAYLEGQEKADEVHAAIQLP